MIFKFFICFGAHLYKAVEAHECKAIHFLKLAVRYSVLIGIKIAYAAENKSRRISYLAVYLAELLQYILGNADIGMIIRRCDPQPQYICAVLADYIVRIYGVAKRF